MALQFIRGLDADRLNLTPAVGEPLFTTDTKKLYIGDGSTPGGLEVSGGTDSASVIALIQQTAIDSAAVLSLIEANNTDSAEITNIVNSLYIQARQSYNATTLGGHDSAYFLNYFNFTNTPNVLDSANIVSIVDSAYIAARTPPSLTIREVDSADNVNKAITNVSAINFDNWTGFQVSDLGNGEVKVALGSGFKTITVSGQDDIVAIGEDTLTLEAGTGITLTTDAVTKALTITAATDSAYVAAQVSTAINNLVDTAPAALDTLNELAAALGDDANFATTVTNSIATKLATTDFDATFDSALSTKTTDDVTEGSTNLYYTDARVTTLVDSAYVQTRQTPQDFAYSSLTGAPITVSSFTNDAGYTTYDSASTIGLVDSAYVQARQTAQDFAYSSLTGAPNVLDSADVAALIEANSANVVVSGTAPSSPAEGDLWYDNVTTGQLYTYVGTSWLSTAGLTTLEFSSVGDLSDVDITTTAPANGEALVWDSANSKFVPGVTFSQADFDSAFNGKTTDNVTEGSTNLYYTNARVTTLVDSAYVQTRQTPQDFAYSSLTGAPTNVSSFTNDAGYTTYDSANTVGLVDSAYVQARQTPQDFAYSSLTGAPTAVSSFTNDANYIATNDSATLNSLTTIGNVVVGGNLQVNGTTVTVNSTNLDVTDNMIYLNAGESAGSPTASIDVGWAANVNDDGSYAHVGFFRDATDNTFKVYQGYTPEPDAAVQIDTSHASFALAPFAASTLTGQYLGFDSDVTAAGLATQSYVTTTIDSAYVNALVTPGATVSVSGTAPVSPNEGDLWYDNVTTGQLYTYVGTSWLSTAGLTTLEFSSIADLSDVDSTAPTTGQYLAWNGTKYVPTTLAAGTDSATVAAIVTGTVDSAYVQARQTPQDFAYASLTGAPTNVSSFTNDAGYLTTAIDSAGVSAIVTSYGYTTFDSVAASGLITTAINNLVDAAPAALDTLNELAAALGDDANFATTVTNAIAALPDSAEVATIVTSYGYTTFDSADAIALIDSAYINARVAAGTDSATVVSIINTTVDSAYVNALITLDATVSVSGTAPVSPNEGDLWYDNVTTGQLYTYVGTSWLSTAGLTTLEFSSIADLSDVDSSAPTNGQYLAWDSASAKYVPTTLAAGTDSATVAAIVTSTVDSAYVQARQTAQDFAYASLTGAPTNVSSFTNDAGYLTTAIDSAGVASIVTSYGYTTYDSANFTGQLTAATGTSVQAYDANLTSFVSAFTLPTADGTTGQVLVTNGSGTLSFADQSGGGGGGSVDSASVAAIVADELQYIDIGDIVGVDGNPGEVLQSNGNGNSSWVDMKLIARQKAFAMSLIFS